MGGIAILWTIGIFVLLWQISRALANDQCTSIDEINGDLIASLVLLIPSILRAVCICGIILNERRGG